MRARKKRREPVFPPVQTELESPVPMSVERFPAGQDAVPGEYQPGDFILTRSDAFSGKLIRFGQWLRYSGDDRKYIWCNHAALIETAEGGLIEAVGNGVQRNHLSHYGPKEYVLVRVGSFVYPEDREQIVAFAQWCLDEEYGYMTIVSIALNMLTGGKFTFGVDGQSICSGMVARALERGNAIFQTTPSHIAPADLAKYFDVAAPAWLGSSTALTPAR